MQPPLSRFRWPRLSDRDLRDRSRAFGYRRSATHTHRGVDLGARAGTPVWAVADGVIEQSQDMRRSRRTEGFDGYGSVVVLRLLDGRRVLYAHLDGRAVDTGAHVVEGQQLGVVGTTRGDHANPGRRFAASGAHLHLELSGRPYPLEPEEPRLDPKEFNTMPPAPDAPDATAADSLDRWAKLDGLIVQLHQQTMPRLVNDEQRARLDRGLLAWQVAHRGAAAMQPDARVALLDWWIAFYNQQRDNAIKWGLKNAPPKARRSPDLGEQTERAADRVVEAAKDVAMPIGFGLLLVVGLWLWSQQQRERVVVEAHQ